MSLDTFKMAKKTIGVKQVTKAVEKDLVMAIYIAQDAEERLVEQLSVLCTEKNVPVDKSSTMAELGKACSIEVGAAAVAVLK